MSRCFPFPPPGYEKKPLTDDLDLLKKEKRKEKKHKKDKKDKDKKEGKEKREKDRSESKHKDKKDKKDKHRDKKKDKDKAKTTQDEGYNGHNNTEQIQDKKHLLQFRNGESNKDHRPSSSSDDKKQPQFQGQNGDLARNRDSENYKFVQELDRRIRDEEKGSGSHQFFVEGRKISYNNDKHDMQNAVARNKINGATPPPPPSQPPPPPPQPSLPPPQPPLDNRRLESDERRGDKRKHKDRDKQRAGKEKDKLKEKSEREKNKHIRKSDILENSEGVLKKRKEMETNGVLSSHENEARPNKMARPISNISPQNQNPSSSFLDNQKASSHSQNNFKTGTKSQKVNGMNSMSSPPFSLPAKKPPIPASNHIQHKPSPIKSPPPPPPPSLPIPPPVITNTNHVAAQSPPLITTKPPPPPPIPVSNSIPVVPPARQPVSRPKPPPAVVKAAPVAAPPPRKKVEPVKPPHPDTKYLSQILSVPKPEEWGGVDEQEWLFEGAVAAPRRERAAEMAEVQVWSEAKQIESVDVCALPYVIPY